MESNYRQNEIDKRCHRATELEVDDLICNVFFEAGLRDYASWPQDPNWVHLSISEVRGCQRGCLGFTLKGRRYSIHTEEDHLHPLSEPDTAQINVELLLDGNLVFGAAIGHQTVEGLDSYSPKRVTEFIEGDWIEDLRDLGREMKRVAKRNHKRKERERAQKDGAKFGISSPNQSGSGLGTLREIWRATVAGHR